MKKEIGTIEKRSGKAESSPSGVFSLPNLIGPKPIIRYSHSAARKLLEGFGYRFEVRHLGESRLGLLRGKLRETAPGTRSRKIIVDPGFGDTPLSWWNVFVGLKPILRKTADEIVIVDYPGYSGFLHDETAFDSMDELVRVFREVVDTLSPETIVGHSLGAWLAADYSIERPDVPKRLVLVDPGGLVETESDREGYRGIFRSAIESGPEKLIPHAFAKTPRLLKLVQGEFFSFLKSPEAKSFVESFEDRHLLNGRVGKIRAEVDLLWGDRDTLTPTRWISSWLRELPADRVRSGVLIRGSGHSPQVEKTAVLIALLSQIFLGKVPKDRPYLPFWKVVAPNTASGDYGFGIDQK